MRSRIRASSLLGSMLSLMILSSLAVMGVLMDRFVRSELDRQVGESDRLLAASIAHEVGAFLSLHLSSLELLAGREGGAQAPDALKMAFPAFESVLFADAEGRVRYASTGSEELGFDFSARDYFQRPRSSGGDYVSPPFISGTSYTAAAILSRPVREGVAIAYVSLRFMNDFISGLPLSRSKSISLFDSSGAPIARGGRGADRYPQEIATLEAWFRDRARLEAEGRALAFRHDTGETLVFWSRVPGPSGWIVTISESTGEVFAALRFLRTVLAVALAAYALLSLPVTFWIVRLVRLDVRRLTDFSRDIADGRTEVSVNYRGFYDFKDLALNLERMGAAIREREALLKANEKRLFDLIDFLPVPVVLLSPDQRIELLNRSIVSLLGWTQSEIKSIDDWWRLAYPDERYREEVVRFWNEYTGELKVDRRPMIPFKGSLRCRDGSDRLVVGEAAFISERYVVTFVDITDSELAAERTAASLLEKEVLLKEIHHRVKNNLQVVMSLLELKTASDPANEDIFRESVSRIHVMAGIHELLYKSPDLSRINLAEYGETIVSWLVSTYALGPIRPLTELELEAIDLHIDRAMPCGLILNEAITNSLKYAFPEGREDPRISVSARRLPDGLIELRIADNGVGLPPSFDSERCGTLGMQLIKSLCEQMHAAWELETEGGLSWRIRFSA